MIEEDYVSFEVAKLLKEKGFDEGCSFVVNTISKGVMPVSWPTTNSDIEDEKASLVALPTLQMAMKWLREMYGLIIVVHPSYPIDGIKYESLIYRLTELKDASVDEYNYDDKEYDNYEQACEAAIKYSLENLV